VRDRLGPLAAALGTLLLDQAAKFWVLSELPLGASVPYGAFFNLVRVENRGVAFGLLSGLAPSTSAFLLSALSLRFGAVVDFLDVHLGGAHWPAFNVADVAICAGVGLLVLELWRADGHGAEDERGTS
jgi:signal peptidase II